MKDKFGPFAQKVVQSRYSHIKSDGTKETWEEIAQRVAKSVFSVIPSSQELSEEVEKLIVERKFIPGGRYLHSAGLPFHQVNNCFSGETRFITKKGIRSLQECVNQEIEIRNRFGEWEKATVKCFGEQQIYKLTLVNGIEIYTTSEHLWWQKDETRVSTMEVEKIPLSEVKKFPDIDPEGVRHGIIFGDGNMFGKNYSGIVFVNPQKDQSLVEWFKDEEKEVEVGFGAKIKVRTIRQTKAGTRVALQPAHYKKLPEICSPEYARGFIAGLIATDGHASKTGSVTIACEGYEKGLKIAEIAVLAGCVVNSVRIAQRVSPFDGSPRELTNISIKPFSAPILLPSHKTNLERTLGLLKRSMFVEVESVEITDRFEPVFCVVAPQSESFTLSNGLITSNCILTKAEDHREGWGDLLKKVVLSSMTGAGIGTVFSGLRAKNMLISGTLGKAGGPCSLMQMVNETARGAMQGGHRRAALWAGLHWDHPDVLEFIKLKHWSKEITDLKARDYSFPAPMDYTNISVILNQEFFAAYHVKNHPKHSLARTVYWLTLKSALQHGDPGFSIDVKNPKECLRNPCTEIVSEDSDDVCCIGSINMAQISSPEDLEHTIEVATAFLLSGTLYSDTPYEAIKNVRDKNRRIGLGLMGLHEFNLVSGLRYGDEEVLKPYMEVYQKASRQYANRWAEVWGLAMPKAVCAIAPTGTIGSVAETSTGIEPIFASAYRRRYLDQGGLNYQMVIDPVARKLVRTGVDPDKIEDAYNLAEDMERRVKFQRFIQGYVDQGVSSTINMPSWGSELNNENTVEKIGNMLIQHLPYLRGITLYPDGARSGQPLTKINLRDALKAEGEIFMEESVDICSLTNRGSCGS